MKVSNNFSSIEQMVGKIGSYQTSIPNETKTKNASSSISNFRDILQKTQENASEETNALKFSKHANERLESRNIDLSQSQLNRLVNGTQKAREKGINESLVMVDNLAFIVNVKNNTVVTAVNDAKDNVFTNIDGAVIG
ncbi:MAG: hypothetical protein PWP24_1848 [Clostridiales bacterium]|nr:hypothetical protein [Clostridiales bacterium]